MSPITNSLHKMKLESKQKFDTNRPCFCNVLPSDKVWQKKTFQTFHTFLLATMPGKLYVGNTSLEMHDFRTMTTADNGAATGVCNLFAKCSRFVLFSIQKSATSHARARLHPGCRACATRVTHKSRTPSKRIARACMLACTSDHLDIRMDDGQWTNRAQADRRPLRLVLTLETLWVVVVAEKRTTIFLRRNCWAWRLMSMVICQWPSSPVCGASSQRARLHDSNIGPVRSWFIYLLALLWNGLVGLAWPVNHDDQEDRTRFVRLVRREHTRLLGHRRRPRPLFPSRTEMVNRWCRIAHNNSLTHSFTHKLARPPPTFPLI